MSGWNMLPQRVEDAIETIASDHTSGASRIARLGLKGLEELVAASGGRPDAATVREAATRLSQAQTTNAALYNLTHAFAELVAEGQGATDVLTQLLREQQRAGERVARNFVKIAPGSGSVVTLTYSDNVLACLRLAHEKGCLERVVVMESRPLFEGRFLVVALTETGIPATLVPDALGPASLADATYALVGADSVLRDGAVVNKVGSYGLALAAADRGKPFYVACESLKFDARFDAASWPGSPPMPAREVWDQPPERIDVANRYFEVVPNRLVTRVVTDRGSYEPDVIRTMLGQAKRQE